MNIWTDNWDTYTLRDVGIKIEVPTEILETFYERAVTNQKQVECYLHVVGQELEKRNVEP